MASALAGLGRPAEAVARAAAVAREHPEPGTVHYRVGLALQAHGDLASAEAKCGGRCRSIRSSRRRTRRSASCSPAPAAPARRAITCCAR